jgi:hypothetical protein
LILILGVDFVGKGEEVRVVGEERWEGKRMYLELS